MPIKIGPRIFLPAEQRIAPDFFGWLGQGPEAAWIEAKHKTAFTWHRETERFVTGIDLPNYNDYLAVEDASPWPVWLLFLHKGGIAKDSPRSPAGLFGHRLDYLREHENHRHANGGRRGMVYWWIETLLEFDRSIAIKVWKMRQMMSRIGPAALAAYDARHDLATFFRPHSP